MLKGAFSRALGQISALGTPEPQDDRSLVGDPCGNHAAFAWFAHNVSFEAGVDFARGAGVSASAAFSLEEISAEAGFGGISYGQDAHVGVNIQTSGAGVQEGWFGQSQLCVGRGLGLCIKTQSQRGTVSWSLMIGGVHGASFTNHLMYHKSLLGPAPMTSPSRCTKQ